MIDPDMLDKTVYRCIIVASEEWKPSARIRSQSSEEDVMALRTQTRTSIPARWIKAAERAVAEGIQIRQLVGSGAWVASSGSDPNAAYEVAVTGNVANGCTCLAGVNDDPVCKHRAAFYLLIGALDLPPEPEPPALGVSPVVCFRCRGASAGCPVCQDAGFAFLSAQAAALRAAA
jgi:hypothetical protein